VIYFLDTIDEYLLQHLREFDGKSLVSAASSEVELADDAGAEAPGEPLAEEAMTALCEFLKEELGERVDQVAPGKRLVSSPAAVLVPAHGMSAQMRQMLQAMNPGEPLPPQKVELEVNPRHGLVHALAAARATDPELAKVAAAQLLDQALLAAGLLEDRVSLIDRGFRLMEAALKKTAG